MSKSVAVLVLASSLSVAPSVGAQSSPTSDDLGERAVALGASVVPGAVVHGSGTWVRGDRTTGGRLLAMEGIGVGMILIGGVPIWLTGASRYVVGPAVATTTLGAGLVAISWTSDLYGASAPVGGWGSMPRELPWIRTELGFRNVSDPRFEYTSLIGHGIDFRSGRFRLHPTVWWSSKARTMRARLSSGYRFLGPLPHTWHSNESRETSSLDLEPALTYHPFGSDGFTITTAELALRSRFDLGQLGPSLEGSFSELGVGLAVQSFSYQLPGVDVPPDIETMLLARCGFGVLFGSAAHPVGEALLYYDHRHDDFAGGLLSSVPTSGVLGHFGLESQLFFFNQWGFSAHVQIGSAVVSGASILFRDKGQFE